VRRRVTGLAGYIEIMNACAGYRRILYGGGRLLAGNQQVIAVPAVAGVLRPITMSGVLGLGLLTKVISPLKLFINYSCKCPFSPSPRLRDIR